MVDHGKLRRHAEGQKHNALLVWLFSQLVDDWIARVEHWVIEVFDPGLVGPREVRHEQEPEQDAAPTGAFPGKGAAQNQGHESQRASKEEYEPPDLTNAEPSDGARQNVFELDGVQIALQGIARAGIDHPRQHAQFQNQQASMQPILVEPGGFHPPTPEARPPLRGILPGRLHVPAP